MNILIYDSGKGGLSVFHLLKQWIEDHHYSSKISLDYFADTANYPYGTKSDEELQQIVSTNLSQFQKDGTDIVGVACNTASGVIEKNKLVLGDAMNHVSTILEPTFSKIKTLHPSQLFIIGSQYTVDHHLYEEKLHQDFPSMEIVEHPEQVLINAIEYGEKAEIEHGVRRVIQQVPNHWYLLLACTHFSLVREVFEKEIEQQNKEIILIDPAEELAGEIKDNIGKREK